MDQPLGALLSGEIKSVWTNGPESPSRVSPETGIGLWMALPSLRTLDPWNRDSICDPGGLRHSRERGKLGNWACS